jgi:hypothetical protein
MLRSLVLATCLLSVRLAGAAEPAADPFAGLRFLVGEWVGNQTGAAGEPSGGFSLAPDLGGHVLVRHNEAIYPPKPGEKEGAHHTDLMIVYPEDGLLKATYFDNEGHVIHYVVTATGKSVTFEIEESPKAPRFKLVNELKDDGQLGILFSIARPGQPYKPYITATAHRKQ